MPSSSVTIVSKTTVCPDKKSNIKSLKLSVSDIPMLSCQYIQKGVLFTKQPYSFTQLITSLKLSLSKTLSYFPAFAGRFHTDAETGHIYIDCNDNGMEFIEAQAVHLRIKSLLPEDADVPNNFKEFFAFDRTLSYSGHYLPLAAVQVTELNDGVFIGITVNHAVTDGTSFWHFFNTFAEIHRANKISISPDFCRNTVFDSPVVLRFPPGGPTVTFSGDEPLRERIFHFSREAILRLKHRANNPKPTEILGKQIHDSWKTVNNGFSCNGSNGHNELSCNGANEQNGYSYNSSNGLNGFSYNGSNEISSFQSLCAQLWRSVTRARKLEACKKTTFRMAVNCRHRLDPKLNPYYFGNAIQSIPTYATVDELLTNDLRWGAEKLHHNVVAYRDETVREGVKDWEKQPRVFPLGNFDGASITMGSSPRFPMYNNDFGWGLPLAVRSGRANKFDGKISAFPGRDGKGSVDLEVVLAPGTMKGIENDPEFMQYVSEVMY